jgi:hypothetical protein
MTRYSPEEQRQRTLHAIHASGLELQDVWLRYFSLTGNADEFELDAYLNGLTTLTPQDRNLVSHAVNELINETPPPTAPYNNDPSDNPIPPHSAVALDALDHLTEPTEDGGGHGPSDST